MLKPSNSPLPFREKEKLEVVAVFDSIRRYARALDQREGEVRRAGKIVNVLLLLFFAVLLAGLSVVYLLQHAKGR